MSHAFGNSSSAVAKDSEGIWELFWGIKLGNDWRHAAVVRDIGQTFATFATCRDIREVGPYLLTYPAACDSGETVRRVGESWKVGA